MLTGAQYLQSLDDGRATYFEGERVHDLPSHPQGRNHSRSRSRELT